MLGGNMPEATVGLLVVRVPNAVATMPLARS